MRTTLHRLLKPRTPLDCPACRLACAHSTAVGPAPASVRPWREMKSRRGAPKRIPTDGFACPNRQCPYFGITDASIHALVGDGKHGHVERIQTFRCQACRSTFSARRDTPLYRLKTPSQQVAVVLAALAEGLDASAAERVFGYRQATITTWLSRAGQPAHTLHEHFFCHLRLPHLQLDELRTCWPIWSGGVRTITLCVLTNPSEWRSCSPESEVANWRRNAIGNGPQRWQQAEHSDDGQRVRCSLTPCRPFPLERHSSRMWEKCHVVECVGNVQAEEVGWGLTSR